jgi:predicted MFS family arabinose efflux permease
MRLFVKPFLNLYMLQALAKGLSTAYFILLAVFYAKKLLTAAEIGYIGAFFIVLLIIGAVVVARWLHNLRTKSLLLMAATAELIASLLLLTGSISRQIILVSFAYGAMGLATGVAMSAIGALSASLTVKGERFKVFAKLWMLVDVVRIVLPVLITGLVIISGAPAAVGLILGATAILLLLACSLPSLEIKEQPRTTVMSYRPAIHSNKAFSVMLLIEFLDSFASSQLFVYLPLLLLAKGYTLSSSLLLQTFVFSGYFCGRWLIGNIAERYTGQKAIAFAETGMMLSIILLLVTKQLWLLYSMSFIFGIFARGTSPTIHALAFDTLTDDQVKQGSALHIIAGDSGSAIGQLLFGLLIAWFSARAPFIVAAIGDGLIVIICLVKGSSLSLNTSATIDA